jgi:hypothetical protein
MGRRAPPVWAISGSAEAVEASSSQKFNWTGIAFDQRRALPASAILGCFQQGEGKMTSPEYEALKLAVVSLGVCIAQFLRMSDPAAPKKLKLLSREMSEHLKGVGSPHAADIVYQFGSSLTDKKFFPPD